MVNNSVAEKEVSKLQKLKKIAATRAVDFIESGMVVGLGTGSTAEFAIEELAERVRAKRLGELVLVPTSLKTELFARKLGLILRPLEVVSELDLNIDGADEVDTDLNLIKGGGGALLREKIVAQSSNRNIVVVDENKLSEKLGTKFLLPVEVFPFAVSSCTSYIESLGGETQLRRKSDGSVFTTDQGNYIVDCNFGPISDPKDIADKLASRAGIAEHGLFIEITSDLIVGTEDGIKHITKQ